MTPEGLVLALTLAVGLDMCLGDPRWLPHPVRWMGAAIGRLEPRFRALSIGPATAGALMTVLLAAATWVLSTLLVALAQVAHPAAAVVLEAAMLYACLSARSLADAALEVESDLARRGLTAARRSVAMIVGRETDRLDADGVTRATVETVAENLVDGVIAPLFFAVLGGAPLALAYKMVNTLDSMIGYKNERYLHFGRTAARLDDAANFIPARLSVPFIALAAQWLSGRGREVLTTVRRDGRAHASPNAGFPEAAFAGALGVWMGGPNHYHGRRVDKPIIGKDFADARPVHIRRAVRLMIVAAVMGYVTASTVVLLWP